MEDYQIVELYWKRDQQAIRETENKYGHYLTKIALNILADLEDSKESVNDTYLKAWNSMPPHKPGILATYLGKITRQVSIDIFRKRTSKKRQPSQYALCLREAREWNTFSPDPVQEAELHMLTAGIALIIAAAALFSRMLLPGRELALSRSSENVTVTYTEHVPPSFSSGSLNYAYSEEEIFSMPDTAVFKGTVTSIQNIENLWVEDTDTIAALETGMTGIFMPMIYDENSVLEENGATLFLKDIADYGFYDGVRFAFLETDHGLVFDRSTYQSIAQAQNLDEIEDYILKMLEK